MATVSSASTISERSATGAANYFRRRSVPLIYFDFVAVDVLFDYSYFVEVKETALSLSVYNNNKKG